MFMTLFVMGDSSSRRITHAGLKFLLLAQISNADNIRCDAARYLHFRRKIASNSEGILVVVVVGCALFQFGLILIMSGIIIYWPN